MARSAKSRPTIHTRAIGSAVVSMGLVGAGFAAAADPAEAQHTFHYCSGAHFASSRCWGPFWIAPGYNSRWYTNSGQNGASKTACVQAEYRPSTTGTDHYGPYTCTGHGAKAISHPYTRYSDQSERPLCWNGLGTGSELTWLDCWAQWSSGG